MAVFIRYFFCMKQSFVSGKMIQDILLLLGLWISFFVLITGACRYEDLPVIPHAHILENRTSSVYENGRGVAYGCERGFKVASGTNLAVCLQHGNDTLQWSTPTLLCVLDECGNPPDLFHAEEGRVEGRVAPYPVGTKAVYTCLSGYYKHEGTDTADCIRDSDGMVRWTKPTIDCRARNCNDPGIVRNAERSGHLFTHPHHVNYVCNRGYFTRDKTILYCLPSGTWSDDLPHCEKVHCPVPEDPENGQARAQDLSYQSTAVYSCSSGYLLLGDRERHCTTFGNWSGAQPTCKEVHCKPFHSLSGGQVVFGIGHTKPGSIVILKCFEPEERKTLKCTDSGEWNTEPPECKVLDECGNPPDLLHAEAGRVEGRVAPYPVGTKAVYTCLSGYYKHEGTDTADCIRDSDGMVRWTNPTIDCRGGTRCEFPGDIHHGSLVGPQRETSFPSHVNLTFQCDQGYKLKGQATLRCLPTGEWEPSRLPACDKVVPMVLIIGLTIGLLFLVVLAIVVAVVFVRKRKSKAQDALGVKLKRKANSIDARDSEETHCLERDKKPIPVTSL